jgi:hypothetical protein
MLEYHRQKFAGGKGPFLRIILWVGTLFLIFLPPLAANSFQL